MPEAEVRFTSQEEYDHLRKIRDRHGVVWRGMLLQGARQVTGYDLHQALRQLDAVSVSADPTRSHPQQHPVVELYPPPCSRENQCPEDEAISHPVSSEISGESEDTDAIPGAAWEPPYEYNLADSDESRPEESE